MVPFDDQDHRDQTAGFIGALVAIYFLWRTLPTYLVHWQRLFMPSGIWFLIVTTTCLALLIWSVGHLLGDYQQNDTYARLINTLSRIAVIGILLLAGYTIAT
ncbi:hypothetical protein DMJ13_23335 [halophilic archaeon]|nr:hypothetical protein DMJ13_23335 [halophilic archaeon]